MGCCCMRGKIQNFRRHRKVVAFWLATTYVYYILNLLWHFFQVSFHATQSCTYYIPSGSWTCLVNNIVICFNHIILLCVNTASCVAIVISILRLMTRGRLLGTSVINNTYCRMSFVWMWEMCLMYASIYVYFYASLICIYGIPTTFWR